MRPRRLQILVSIGLCVSLPFMPLGCGGPTAMPRVYASPDTGPALPDETIAALTACVAEGADRLKETSYPIIVDLNVNEDGLARGAKVKDSIVGDPGIESCLAHTLGAMSLPASIMRHRTPARVSADARHYMGNPGAAALVALGPIALAAAGITIVLVVMVYVVVDAATRDATDDEERERCKKEKRRCMDECEEEFLPTGQSDGMPYHKCLRICLEAAGCWRMFN